MKQLPLALIGSRDGFWWGSWLRIYQETSEFNRKFHTLKLEDMTRWNKNAFKSLSKCGAEIRVLTIQNCVFHIRQMQWLNKIFKSLTKLEKLHLYDNIIDKTASEIVAMKVNPINYPHLKSVVLISGNVCVS